VEEGEGIHPEGRGGRKGRGHHLGVRLEGGLMRNPRAPPKGVT
jgi:hypothetical protein